MHDKATPKRNTGDRVFRLITPAALLAGLALALCWVLIFVYAPRESTLGLPQKIFYLHLPLAWWALSGFFLTFVASIVYLCTGKEQWDAAAAASAEVSLVFACSAVIAGSIWAKASWGAWWTWDARLTTALIMCFVYAGYLILRSLDMPPARRARAGAVFGIIAFLDVPLVFFSARLWSYIHPPSISLEPEMKLTLAACLAAFAPLWFCLAALRMKLDLDGRRFDALRAERLSREERRSL
ncbi:MAG: cytochrome c biogenesis protein CcsA [Desulfovibrio sp.]|jgi:heme exporter protein C|nr:cytochrome c biogenesis protein CcsA [Desulfovibrio sp.]